jgi:hypothetical protein
VRIKVRRSSQKTSGRRAHFELKIIGVFAGVQQAALPLAVDSHDTSLETNVKKRREN